MKRALSTLKKYLTKKGHFDKNPGGGKDARKMKKGGRAKALAKTFKKMAKKRKS